MDYRATNFAKIKVCCIRAINLIFPEVYDTIGDRKAVCAYAKNAAKKTGHLSEPYDSI